MEIAPSCEAMVVIGSANSSNTNALAEARSRGRMPGGVPHQRA